MTSSSTETATTANAATPASYSPSAVQQRIEALEAEARSLARRRDGYTANPSTPYARTMYGADFPQRSQLATDIDQISDELAYWRGLRAEQYASGEVAQYSTETISVGDSVKLGDSAIWWPVTEVDPQTVTVQSPFSGGQVRYRRITDRISLAEAHAREAAEAATEPEALADAMRYAENTDR